MKEYAWICHIYIHGAVNMKFEMLSTCLQMGHSRKVLYGCSQDSRKYRPTSYRGKMGTLAQ